MCLEELCIVIVKSIEMSTNSGISVQGLKKHLEQFLPPSDYSIVDDRGVLKEELLDEVKEIDFVREADVESVKDLRAKHFHVITIKKLLDFSRSNGWQLARYEGHEYAYNASYWVKIDKEELVKFIGKFAVKLGMDRFRANYYKEQDELYKQFIRMASFVRPRKNNKTLINLMNGTFEVNKDGVSLREFRQNDFLRYKLPFKYDPSSVAPQWQRFLNKVLPDVESQKLLAEYIGYVFVKPSELKLEKVLLLYGGGSNGKSVVFDVITKLLGESNVSHFGLDKLTDENGYYRSKLSNKLLNYGSELKGKMDCDSFKKLASNEPIDARLPFGEPMIIENYAKMIFNCNELPFEVEHTHGFFRRFLIIPFNTTISDDEKDPYLAKRITDNELSGVFNWVLEGLSQLLQNRRFTESDLVNKQLDRFKAESDSVQMFIEEKMYEQNPTLYKTLSELYLEYRGFCIEDNYKAIGKKKFSSRLSNLNYLVKRLNVGNVVYISKKSN